MFMNVVKIYNSSLLILMFCWVHLDLDFLFESIKTSVFYKKLYRKTCQSMSQNVWNLLTSKHLILPQNICQIFKSILTQFKIAINHSILRILKTWKIDHKPNVVSFRF